MHTLVRGTGIVGVIVALFAWGVGFCADTGTPDFTVPMGRAGLLRNVHGYDCGGTALVPVRGLCEWLGAQVTYANGTIVATLNDRRLELRVGSSMAALNGMPMDLGGAVREFSGIACAPVRSLGGALGATVEYNDPSTPYPIAGIPWYPNVTVTQGGRRAAILLHEESPDVVTRFIADMENTVQAEAGYPSDMITLGTYGVDWITIVKTLKGNGSCFIGDYPAIWREDNPVPEPPAGDPKGPGFYDEDVYGVYGVHDGKWRLLMSGNGGSYTDADVRATGISPGTFAELGLVHERDCSPLPSGPPGPPPDMTGPPVVSYLTPQTGRFAYLGDGCFVGALNFRRMYDFTDKGVKVLGEITTPVYERTSRPVHVELSLMAYGEGGGLLGSSQISFSDIPDIGTTVPFEVLLTDVGIGELAYVRIVPKGAWTYGRD